MTVTRARTVTVLTHRRPSETAAALERLREAAARAGVELRFDSEETRKHGLRVGRGLRRCDAPLSDDVDLCVVLGGDGTILRALRRYAGTSVPVFAVNFGEVGFLATIDPDEVDRRLRPRAVAASFEVLTLPAIALEPAAGAVQAAINDVSIHRKIGERVARRSPTSSTARRSGSVRCDGLVDRDARRLDGLQPGQRRPGAGLGRGGLRRLVHRAALADRAGARRRAGRRARRSTTAGADAVDVSVDGRPVGELEPGEALIARGSCARRPTSRRCPGSSFYRRLREKFGRLAS